MLSSQAIRRLTDSLQHELSLYGYEVIETPMIEPADLFLTRAGDQLITRLFTFERYGQQLALRPEFTAAAAHRYAQRDSAKVVRWQFCGPVFEDNPGSRDYQQLSIGAELIGMSGPAADAEIISLAAQGVLKQRVPDWKLMIGHSGLVRHLLASFDLDRRTERFLLNHLTALRDPELGTETILREFDRNLMGSSIATDHNEQPLDLTEIGTQRMLNVLLDASQHGMTMGGRTQHDIAQRLLRKHQRFTERQQVVAALELLAKWVAISTPAEEAFAAIEKLLPADDETGFTLLSNWRAGVELLASYNMDLNHVVIQPHVARNWAYYTGIVFEILTDDGVRLAGGGRYDELVSLVGGKSVPAVGFAYYLDQIPDCIESTKLNPPALLAIEVNADNRQVASRLAFRLRSHDIAVALTDNRTAHKRGLIVESDGRVRANNKTYSSAETAALIADILAGVI